MVISQQELFADMERVGFTHELEGGEITGSEDHNIVLLVDVHVTQHAAPDGAL
jgi:hypothetical protein